PKINPAQTTRFLPIYDDLRRIIAIQHLRDPLGAPTPIENLNYGWDAMNNKTSASRPLPLPENHSYTCDAANRLVQSQLIAFTNPPVIINYNLDGVGNRTNVVGGPDAGSYTMNSTLCEPGDFQMNQYSTTPSGGTGSGSTFLVEPFAYPDG